MNNRQPTPAELKRFKELEKLMRLADKAINRQSNFAVKEGYAKAVELLRLRITDLTKSAVGDLKTVQGRAIAMCAMDYLVDKCSEDTLCGVPIKKM